MKDEETVLTVRFMVLPQPDGAQILELILVTPAIQHQRMFIRYANSTDMGRALTAAEIGNLSAGGFPYPEFQHQLTIAELRNLGFTI